MILAYLPLGWALVPLHDVSAGRCSCGDAACRSAGKHPRLRAWQEESQLVRSPEALAALHGEHPEWNWGAATGEPSGFWALDYDPAHCGAEGHDFIARLVAEAGAATRQHRTGAGGTHLLYSSPGDFVPRNIGVKARGDGRVPVGIDVRGWHGQIVLPPSVSDRGPYSIVRAGEVRPAPGWLLEAIRPPAYEPSSRGEVSLSLGDDRGARYAAAAGAALLAQLREASVGTRNDTAFAVACRLIELANAAWSGVGLDAVRNVWWAAAAAHPDGAWVPESELGGVWARALARVGSAAAMLPDGWGGELFVPFSTPATGPDASSAPGGQHAEMSEMPERTGGGREADGGRTASVPADPVEAMISRMLTDEQLSALPPPEPLVNGLLDIDSCAWLIGEPGTCKSFVAIDLAAHVGRGQAWQGRAVRQGLTVYVVAEGARGMRLRVDAWKREYGPMKDVLFLPEPVLADERRVAGGWSILVEACRRLAPALVIIDTQARATVGLNENDNSDMGYYVAQADRIKRATGACVLTVHHVGRGPGGHARGASAIDGAQDAELKIERATGAMTLTLKVDKQKDQVEAQPMKLRLRVSDGGTDERTGRDLSSLVIEHQDVLFLDPEIDATTLQARRAILLYQLMSRDFARGEGGTRAEIKKAFCGLGEIAKLKVESRDKAWRRAWNGEPGFAGLVPRGLVLRRAGAERFRLLVLADQGVEGVLTPNPRDGSSELPPDGWNVYSPGDDE